MMKGKHISYFIAGVGSAFLLIGFLIAVPIGPFTVGWKPESVAAALVVITPTPREITTPLPMATLTADSDIVLFEKISTQAIQASNNALEQMKWVIITLLPILLAIAGGIVSYFVKAQKDLLDYATRIRNDLNEAVQKLSGAEKQATAISSSYMYLLSELSHQSVVFLPPEMAMSAYDQGKITQDEFRESQVWLAWVKWFYMDKEEGFLELEVYKNSTQSLPHSIRRIMVVEIERMTDSIRRRGMIYKREDNLLRNLLLLLDLESIDKSLFLFA